MLVDLKASLKVFHVGSQLIAAYKEEILGAGRAQLPNCMGILGRDSQLGPLAVSAAGLCIADIAQGERAVPAHGHRLRICAGRLMQCTLTHCNVASLSFDTSKYAPFTQEKDQPGLGSDPSDHLNSGSCSTHWRLLRQHAVLPSQAGPLLLALGCNVSKLTPSA